MEIEHLTTANKTIGAKQTAKAIARGEVEMVFVANNSDDRVILPLIELCEQQGLPINQEHSMEELGKAGKIKVKAAAIGVLR